MFKRLQQKWKVNGLQLALVLCTFAIGGSLTGYAGRKLLGLFDIEQRWLWILFYIIIITLLWPIAVLLVSVFFGQFRFFLKYIRRIGVRMGIAGRESGERSAGSGVRGVESGVRGVESGERRAESGERGAGSHMLTTQIAVFASGAGSNAQKIIDYFRNSSSIKVALIICNNPIAGVLQIAAKENIPAILIEKDKFFRGDGYLAELEAKNISFIVLAGFLWKIPQLLISHYPGHIVNIHPALLPLYGGKGMYGNNVHANVIAAGEKESGITIHYVDEHYDHGDIIFQAKCPVNTDDTAESLARRIHQLEHEHYPRVIEKIIRDSIK